MSRREPGAGAAAGILTIGVAPVAALGRAEGWQTKGPSVMNKITGAILMLAAAVSGHGVFVFLASHPAIHKYDIPSSVSKMVMFAIATTSLLGLWAVYYLFRQDLR